MVVIFFLTDISGRLEEIFSGGDVAVRARDHLVRWEPLRPHLGLSRQKEEAIRQTYKYYEQQKRECLEEWKKLKGNKATYGEFITAAEEAKDKQLADGVRAMLSISEDTDSKELHSNASLPTDVKDVGDLGREKVLALLL